VPAALAALRSPSYRIYVAGFAAAATGTWMRSVAQDWLVLELTGSPAAVGITMACQFLPVLLLGLHGGLVADRRSRRALLLAAAAANAVLAALLAGLTLTGTVQAVHVDLLALAGGLVLVVENPARQAFVTETVPPAHLQPAVALAAAVFQMTRLVGPAVAGVLIGTAGTGWVFAATAACSLASMLGLARSGRTSARRVVEPAPGQLRAALRHVAERPAVAATIVLVGLLGMFGLNFPVVLTGMAGTVFAGGAPLYGLFNVVLAVGSAAGALVAGGAATRRGLPIVATAAGFGIAQFAASQMPGRTAFLLALAVMGAVNLAFQALANAAVQTGVDPAMRGRVMGLYMIAFTGGTPLGAPLIGWITDAAGPRVGMAVCGVVPLLAALALLRPICGLRGGQPVRGAAAALHPRAGQSRRERVLGAPPGAVAGHDERRVELGERRDRRPDHQLERGPAQVQPTDQAVQALDRGEPQRVPDDVHRARVPAPGDDDQPAPAHVDDQRLVVDHQRVVRPLLPVPRLVGGRHPALEVGGAVDLAGEEHAAVDEQRRLAALDHREPLAVQGAGAQRG
jgi:MFS family permease